MNSQKTILVTGGAGYIGSNTVLGLIENNYDIIVIDNLSTGFEQLVPKEVTFIKGNIGDKELLETIFAKYSIDAVIHFAANIIVPESVSEPLKYYQNNLVNTITLLQACIDNHIQNFIFSSTAAVYGEPGVTHVAENIQLKPINPYGYSKMVVEQILKDMQKAYNFNYVALRYFNVAGADEKLRAGQLSAKSTHLIKKVSRVANDKEEGLSIFGSDYPTKDGTCIRDYIHVTDLANAHIVALDYLLSGGDSDIFNCGYGHGYSVKEVVQTADTLLGKALHVEYAARREGDPAELVANVGKIKKILGWQPKHDNLEFIIRTALEWEKSLD